MALSGEEVCQIFYQAGWREPALIYAVAIAKRESGWRPEAHRTDNPGGNTGDYGLMQINYVNFPTMQRELGLTNINQLLDPVTNAKAALVLYNRNGQTFKPWSAAPGGWNANGDPLYGTNVDAAKKAYISAVQKGMIGKPWDGTVPDGGIIGDAIGGVGGSDPTGVVGAVNGIIDTATAIPMFIEKLLETHTWVRVAKVVGGIGLIGLGLYAFNAERINAGIGAATSVATKGVI